MLPNARIDQHPEGVPVNGDFFIYRDMANGITKRAKADPFLSTPAPNIEWSSTQAQANVYDEFYIVTRGGNIYQSTINNNQNIPGSEVVGTETWTLLTRGKNWDFWVADTVYIEDEVFVLYELDSEVHIMYLRNGSRPYQSTNFANEYEVDDWVSVTQNHIQIEPSVDSGTVVLNPYLLKKRSFRIEVPLNEPKTWSFLFDKNCIHMDCVFEIDGLHVQTFPNDVKMVNANNALWTTASHTWEPFSIGRYILELTKEGNGWIAEIKGPSI